MKLCNAKSKFIFSALYRMLLSHHILPLISLSPNSAVKPPIYPDNSKPIETRGGRGGSSRHEITHLTHLHFPMSTDTDALDLSSSLLAATEQVSCTSKLRRHCQQSQIISDGQTHAPFASDA